MSARYDDTVDAEPFYRWLEGEVAKYGFAEVGDQIGVTDRRIRTYLARTYKVIRLDTVDRALCAYGDTDLLNELYPCDLPLALVP